MRVYSVSEFRDELNELLSEVTVSIQGEVTGFHVSRNRFVWFSLADENTVIDCFMLTFQLRQQLEDGMEIRVVGSPTMFKKGKFVFRPRQIELIGEGSLRRSYEMLKKQLEKEGLFDESRKRELPRFPERVGLVTSKDAAAYTDFLRIINNRWSNTELFHVDVQVQGERAVGDIVAAIAQLNEERSELEAIVLTRGGGSLEDLHAFNAEEVVRAVYASKIPVIVGVGHERDTSLADLAADVRASTPSNAAELLVPHKDDVRSQIEWMLERGEQSVQQRAREYSQGTDSAIHALHQHMSRFMQQTDQLLFRIWRTVESMDSTIQLYASKSTSIIQLLQSMHPKHVLKKGYSITRAADGSILRSAASVHSGGQLHTELADGTVISTVDSTD